MPRLSPTMEEGKLAKWHVKEGDAVRSGDVIAEIETDKATMEVEAVEEGRDRQAAGRRRHRACAGEPAHRPAARTTDEAERRHPCERGRGRSARVRGLAQSSSNPHPEERRTAPARGEGARHRAGHAQDRRADQGERRERSRRRASSPRRWRGGSRASAASSSPHLQALARMAASSRRTSSARRARHAQTAAHRSSDRRREPLRPSRSRRGGRRVPRPREPATSRAARGARGLSDAKVLALYEPGSYELVPHDTMRRFIAERLTLSKQTIPHFYLAIDCEHRRAAGRPRAAERAGAAGRPARLQALGQRFHHQGARHGAADRAGRQRHLDGSRACSRHRASDIAVAVALEGGGLFTPVIRDAEVKSLSEISNEMKRPRRARPLQAPRAARISGRHHHHLQSRHVRHRPLRCGDQSAASRASWRSAAPRSAPWSRTTR